MEEKYIECPNCLGQGTIFSFELDEEIVCTFCDGEEEVKESKADMYDAMSYELDMYLGEE